MTPRDPFETTLEHWLDAEAAGMAPATIHDDAMRAARLVRQRPTWFIWLRGGVDAAPRARVRPLVARPQVLLVLGLILLLATVVVVGAGVIRQLQPQSSTNGRIMFARDRAVGKAEYVTTGPDGSDEVRFMEADQCGQCTFWSPDGRQIMIPTTVDGRLRTAIIAPDGMQQRTLAFPDATFGLGPGAWSPDGRQVALEAVEADAASQYGIYVTDSDGSSALRQVTTAIAGRTDEVPTYSPDGRRIAFLSKNPGNPPVVYGSGDLFIVNADGTDLRKVNPTGTTFVATAANGRPMAWSPDGRQIVFNAVEEPLDAGRSAVYLANVEGGDPVRISEFGSWIAMVDWSPDGAWIVWGEADNGDGRPRTWIAHPDGTAVRQLIGPGTPISGCCATWSPDGTRLLFQRGDSRGNGDLWTMDKNGAVLDQITHQQARYIWFSWAPAP